MSSLIDTPATRWPNLLFILAFSLVLMQQFWVFGKMPLLFFLFYAIAAYALTKGYLIINKSALICYMIIVICALSSTIVVWQHTGYKGLTSLGYFAVIYALFCLKPSQAVPHQALLHAWQKMTLLTAMLGCIQLGLYASIGIYADLHFLIAAFSYRWTRIYSPARYSTRALPDTSQWNGIFGTLLFFSILGHRTDH